MLYTASSVLAIVGALFVAVKIARHWAEIDVSRFGAEIWTGLVLSALAYGLANTLLARAWWHLLKELEVVAPWLPVLKVYGVSQINKYVPGNIFHLAGRQVLGMAAGWPARPLAKSALWEILLLVALGVLFGTMAIPLLWPYVPSLAAIVIWAGLLAFVHLVLRRIGAPHIASALTWQASFLAVSGSVFVVVLLTSHDADAVATSALPAVCGAYVLAWLAGLVTPGAPAGVGIREAVLLFLLNGLVTPADLLVAVVLGRLVTASGDLFFYFCALSIKATDRQRA